MAHYYFKTVYVKLEYENQTYTVEKEVFVTPEEPLNQEQIILEAQQTVISYHKKRQEQLEWKNREYRKRMERQNAIDNAFVQLSERRIYRDMKSSMIHGIKMMAICKNIPEPIEQMIIKNYESMMTPSEQLADLYFNIPIEFHYNIQEFFTPEEILKFAEIIDGHETSDKLKEHENKKYRKFSRTFNYFRRIKQRSD